MTEEDKNVVREIVEGVSSGRRMSVVSREVISNHPEAKISRNAAAEKARAIIADDEGFIVTGHQPTKA